MIGPDQATATYTDTHLARCPKCGRPGTWQTDEHDEEQARQRKCRLASSRKVFLPYRPPGGPDEPHYCFPTFIPEPAQRRIR